MVEDPDLWNDQQRAQAIMRQRQELDARIKMITELQTGLEDNIGLIELGARMTAIRMADGSVAVYSPITLTEALRHELDEIGPVRTVIAPNKFHHLFVADYLDATRRYRGALRSELPEGRQEALRALGYLD